MKRIVIGIHAKEYGERLARTLSALHANTPEPHEVSLLLDGTEAMACGDS